MEQLQSVFENMMKQVLVCNIV